jgi:uncharacterized coiled-coil protein SlyX
LKSPLVLVRFDHVASVIVNADHGIVADFAANCFDMSARFFQTQRSRGSESCGEYFPAKFLRLFQTCNLEIHHGGETKRNYHMQPLIQLKQTTSLFLIALGFVWLGLLPNAQAVSPPPDGGYPGGNTAEGQNSLSSLTTGGFNTAVGLFSLRSNTTNSFNTAIGAGALFLNAADQNTATGAGALFSNTTGSPNTATGAFALFTNTTGVDNTATGDNALFSNTIGSHNTATGYQALLTNTTGNENTADGVNTLVFNTTGSSNTANGFDALFSNTTGSDNTATGYRALSTNTGGENTAIGNAALASNTTGNFNAAIGSNALGSNTTGNGNIALGADAGGNIHTASGTICIGTPGQDVSDSCFIDHIFGRTSFEGAAVFINSNYQLGTTTSSRRFKDDIKPMDKTSEALLALKPVTFRYKKEIDPKGTSQFGLVAEEVEKVNPDLVVRDKGGKPYGVRYDQVNAMLLNEFLKAHRKVEEQETTIAQLKSTVAQQQKDYQLTAAQQQKQIAALTAGLQRVSAQLEVSKPAPKTVLNNQ